MNKRKTIGITIRVVIQLVFCAVVFFLFRTFSVLRPVAAPQFYKEYVCAAIVLVSTYVQALVLYPRLYVKGRIWTYILVSFMTLVLTVVAEMGLIYPQFQAICRMKAFVYDANIYLCFCSAFVFGRNLCFAGCAFMICEFRHDLQLSKGTEKSLLAIYRQISVQGEKSSNLYVQVDKIAYGKQAGNYTAVYLFDGNRYFRYGSLSSLYELLGEDLAVRLSRGCFAMYHAITHYNEQCVEVMGKDSRKEVIPISSRYRESAMQALQSHVLSRTTGEKPATNYQNSKMYKRIYRFIVKHPGCSMSEIQARIPASSNSIYRYLGLLKRDGVIRREGSKKAGGYYAV